MRVTEDVSFTLRSIITDYMNTIEIAIAPAYSGICDSKIIKEQLRPFFIRTTEEGKSEVVMKNMRERYRRLDLPNSYRFAEEIASELLVKPDDIVLVGKRSS